MYYYLKSLAMPKNIDFVTCLKKTVGHSSNKDVVKDCAEDSI